MTTQEFDETILNRLENMSAEELTEMLSELGIRTMVCDDDDIEDVADG